MAPASMETSAATSMTRSSVVRGGGGGGGRGGGRSSSSSSVASVVSVASVASSSSSTTAAAHASHHHHHHSAHHSRDNASDKSSSSSDKQQGQGTSSSSDKQQALSSAEAQWLYNVAAVRDVLKDSLKVHIVKYVGDDDDDLYQYSYRQKHDGENQQPTDTLAVEATSPKKQQWAYASNSPTSRLVANLYSEDINNNARTSTPERRAARAIVGTTTTTATTTATTTTTTTTTRPPPARRSTSPPPHPPQLYEMRTPVLNPLPACASEPLIHYKTGNGLAKGKTALPRGVNQGMQRQMYDEIGAPAATTYTAFHMPLPKTTLRDVEAKRRNTTTKQADIALKTQAREIMARQLRLSRAMRSAAEVLEYPLVRRTQPAGMVSLHPVPRLDSSRQSVRQAQRLCLVPTRRKITPPERGNAAGGGDLPLPVVRV